VSKSTFSPGLQSELDHSFTFHHQSIPVLVSAQLLRHRELGQIDLAKLCRDQQGWLLEVAEVKSSIVGAHSSLKGQKVRIFRAASFLGAILSARVKVTDIVG
jgi:hypothetical protein